MPAKKKPSKQSTAKKAAPKKKSVKKSSPKKTSKTTAKTKPAAKKAPTKKLLAKVASKKPVASARPAVKKAVIATPVKTPKEPARNQGRSGRIGRREETRAGDESAGQSGDLQGLSNIEGADSESVDELLEEGNSFEAGVVQGVEDAGNFEGREVHTHEVPEDDVPEEYLDEE
jgi:hypothetical protein